MGYITYEGRFAVETKCHGSCPTVLVVRGRPTANYAELVIEMRQPSGLLNKHETGMCKACRDRIVKDGPQPGELESIWAADVKQWIESAVRGGTSLQNALLMAEKFVDRTPVRALPEPGRGEADIRG